MPDPNNPGKPPPNEEEKVHTDPANLEPVDDGEPVYDEEEEENEDDETSEDEDE